MHGNQPSPRSNFLSIIINKDNQHLGEDHLRITLLISLLTLLFISLPRYKQSQPRHLCSCVQSIIVYSLISHLRSNLSVGGVFREITPRTRLTCCVARIQVIFFHESPFLTTLPLPVFQVSYTSSFHHRNNLAPSVGN